MNWLTSLISPVANIAGQIIKNRNEISKAKHQAQMQTIQNNADWEAKVEVDVHADADDAGARAPRARSELRHCRAEGDAARNP